jgi:hypothetical protein
VFPVLGAGVAVAHGPCQCTFPTLGRPGALVHVNGPAYKVILNPRVSDFTIEPGGLASAYRRDAPTVTVVSRASPAAARKASFRVPSAMPGGVYLLLIFDGSEGGQHYTWDYFQVAGAPAAAATSEQSDNSSPAWGVLVALGALFAAGLFGLYLMLASRRRS